MELPNSVLLLVDALVVACEDKTFDRVTVKELTDRAHLHRKTFYYYFADKYDLLKTTYDQLSLHYWRFGTLTLTNWERQTRLMLESVQDHKNFYLHVLDYDNGIWQRLVIACLDPQFNWLASTMKLPTESLRFTADFYSGGIYQCLVNWVNEGFQESPTWLTQAFMQMIEETARLSLVANKMPDMSSLDIFLAQQLNNK